MGYPTSIFPLSTRHFLLPALPAPLENRPIPVPFNPETCQHWWNRRSRQWKVRYGEIATISLNWYLMLGQRQGDILLADVLTSYAKVLGDLFVSGCMFLSPGISSTDKPDRNCGGAYMVPLIISIPSLIRLRQCLIEYLRVRNNPNKNASTGWGGYVDILCGPIEFGAERIMQTALGKCSKVFQCFPSHRSERTTAWDRPKVRGNE